MKADRIPHILLFRNWRRPGSALNHYNAICKRWKVDDPYRFGYSLAAVDKVEQIEELWHEGINGNAPNKIKSKNHWNSHILEQLGIYNDKKAKRLFRDKTHHYHGIQPSLHPKNYITHLTRASQMRLRLVCEKVWDITCPICRDSDHFNATHHVMVCSAFNSHRSKLAKQLVDNFGLSPFKNDFKQIIYNPPNREVRQCVDEFLTHISMFEEKVKKEREINMCVTPELAIGSVIDLMDSDNIFRRTIVKNYNSISKEFTIGPSEYSDWPSTDTEVDLLSFGNPDHLQIIPSDFALKFNPVTCDSNLKVLFSVKKHGYVRALSTDELHKAILDGRVSGCPHNGCIARRYISVKRREANAERQGVG